MKSLNDAWNNFVNKHPKAAKWVREGGLFFIFSNLVTIIQYIIYAFLPNLLGLELAGIEWSWPAIPVSLFGIDFTWNAIGYDVVYDIAGNVVIGGGGGSFTWTASNNNSSNKYFDRFNITNLIFGAGVIHAGTNNYPGKTFYDPYASSKTTGSSITNVVVKNPGVFAFGKVFTATSTTSNLGCKLVL